MGAEPEEALLPRAPELFDGYRLLQEYYAMPERFLFVELRDIDRAVGRCAGKELEIILLLDRSEPVLASGSGPTTWRCSAPRRSTCSRAAATASTCPSAK